MEQSLHVVDRHVVISKGWAREAHIHQEHVRTLSEMTTKRSTTGDNADMNKFDVPLYTILLLRSNPPMPSEVTNILDYWTELVRPVVFHETDRCERSRSNVADFVTDVTVIHVDVMGQCTLSSEQNFRLIHSLSEGVSAGVAHL